MEVETLINNWTTNIRFLWIIESTSKLLSDELDYNFENALKIIWIPFSMLWTCFILDNEWERDWINPYLLLLKNWLIFNKLENLPQYWIIFKSFSKWVLEINSTNRFAHSIDVALKCEIVATINNLNEYDINLLIIAWILHDIATPAFWDITKKAISWLNEESNFLEYIKKKSIKKILESNWFKAVQIDDIIKNKWVLWKILDYCDKIAYTFRDIECFLCNIWNIYWGIFQNNIEWFKTIKYLIDELEKIMQENKYLWDIIFDIKIIDNKVVFCNKDRLFLFLKARALMHRLVYMSSAFSIQDFCCWILIKFLVDQKFFWIEDLKNWNLWKYKILNEHFIKKIYEEWNIPYDFDNFLDFFEISENWEIQDWELFFELNIPNFNIWFDILCIENESIKPIWKLLTSCQLELLNNIWNTKNTFFIKLNKQKKETLIQEFPKFYEFLKSISVK